MEFVLWLGFAVIVGFWADSKGRNGFGWGLLSAVISPLLAGIILWFTLEKDRNAKEELAKQTLEAKIEQEKQMEMEKEAVIQRTTVRSEDFVKQIQKNFNLMEHNLLNEDEFIEKKRTAISDLISKKLGESSEDFLSALIPLIKINALNQEDIVSIKKAVL